MTRHDLESVALTLVSEGKGILAADETIPTLTKRFDALGIQSTEQSRRSYREMLFTTPGVAEFISGVIMYDETIRQKSTGGMSLAEVQNVRGIIPGIEVDQDKIRVIRREPEPHDGPVVADPGPADAEVEDVEVHAGANGAQTRFQESHDGLRVRDEAERERVPDRQDTEPPGRLRDRELHVVQPEGVVPVVEPVAVRNDLRGL